MSIINGYGRGQGQGRQPGCPVIVEAASWVVVLFGGPWLVCELFDRAARVLAIMAGAR